MRKLVKAIPNMENRFITLFQNLLERNGVKPLSGE